MAGGEEAPGSSDPPPAITVHVKFSGRTIPLSVTPGTFVVELKSLLQPLTNVLPRGQKLIFKGKVLNDQMSLNTLQILDGSKIMLIASQGLHQGDGPITKSNLLQDGPILKNNLLGMKTNLCTGSPSKSKNFSTSDKTQSQRWSTTGVVALAECCIKVLPEEVWDCGPAIRVLDASNNFLQEVPSKIGLLKSMTKLFLNANALSEVRISWEALSSLKLLKVLSLNQNNLASLPPEICTLISLEQLHIANNKLTSLPDELGFLIQLQILQVGNNRIHSVPSFIGNCCSLVEVDFSSNLLVELPDSFGNLQNLKALHISNNGLKSLPATMFKRCTHLSTLNIHGTEITNDILRQFEGWEDFDKRRRLKYQKQLDFRVGYSGGFDEGADEGHRN